MYPAKASEQKAVATPPPNKAWSTDSLKRISDRFCLPARLAPAAIAATLSAISEGPSRDVSHVAFALALLSDFGSAVSAAASSWKASVDGGAETAWVIAS